MSSETNTRGTHAFTLIELSVIVFTLILLILVVIFGVKARKAQVLRENCVKNLKIIGLAYRTWSVDSADDFPQKRTVNDGGSKEWLIAGQLFLHFSTMSNELVRPEFLVCPADSTKHIAGSFGAGFSNTNVSYFASLDAEDVFPQIFLSGDRNLAVAGRPVPPGTLVLTTNSPTPPQWTGAIHDSCGNIGLGDGSVQMVDQKTLASAVHRQDLATNRLVFP
jgi:competence protein ComGC